MALLEKIAKIKKRTLVRIFTFTLSIILTLTMFVINGYTLAIKYRTQLEYTYQRGLSELSEHLNNIDTTLKKGMYAGTAKGLSNYSMNLWSEAGAAKTCLTQLPSAASELDNTYEFLSQVGNYSIFLSEKMLRGQTINDEERNTLAMLSNYASTLSSAVSELQDEINSGGSWTKEVRKTIEKSGSEEAAGTIYSGLEKIEQSFTNYPTLLYDGPFSSSVINTEPQYLLDKEEVDSASANETANKMTGQTLTYSNEENGVIANYIYSNETTTAAITKKAGVCSYFINYREVGDETIDYARAIEIARAYLSGLDLGEFKESYYITNEGICVINFAYYENDTVFYTDLVKVGVALDNGEIVSFNAQGYIMNHKQRDISQPSNTLEKAQESLSPLLTIISTQKAVIPLETSKEKLCYEFYCTGTNNEKIIVYINTETLEEEDILLVMESDGGTLTL